MYAHTELSRVYPGNEAISYSGQLCPHLRRGRAFNSILGIKVDMN